MIPHQLFDWACTNVPVAYFGYCSNKGYAKERSSLEQRFQLSRTIPGMRKLHSFVRISNSTVEVRHYSATDASRKEGVTLAKNDVPPESIAGFVVCLYEGNWWLACVLEVCSDTKKVKLTFLHPQVGADPGFIRGGFLLRECAQSAHKFLSHAHFAR